MMQKTAWLATLLLKFAPLTYLKVNSKQNDEYESIGAEQERTRLTRSRITINAFLSFFIFITALGFCFEARANQASTEYVQLVFNSLRNEMYGQLNSTSQSLQNQINQFPSLIQRIENVQAQINQLPIITHHIGEQLEGGIVFYVDSSKQHGLVVSLNDLHEGVEWRNGESGDRIVNAKGMGLGSGLMNTKLIVAEQTIDQQDGEFAALLASNYQVVGDGSPCSEVPSISTLCYGGWYLPSLFELMLIHANLKGNNLSPFSDGLYWSSTEVNFTEAWLVNFNQGEPQRLDKSTSAHVRAIHAF